MPLTRLSLLFLIPWLAACSDQRAALELGPPQHSLTLIRVKTWPWEKAARYSIVASRLPDCQRRHEVGPAAAEGKIEVYSPGNDAWILKFGKRLFVVETRTCEGFAPLEAAPEEGLGALRGTFQMRQGTLVVVAPPAGETTDGSAGQATR